jgi:hypothetical protein
MLNTDFDPPVEYSAKEIITPISGYFQKEVEWTFKKSDIFFN